MKKSSSWQKIFLTILALVMVLSITLPSMALNWAGEGTNGGSASASSNGSHTIPYGSAGENVYGFRFTAIDSNGYRRGSQKSLDVWVKSHETAYLERARANKLFYKGEYANNWLDYKEGTDDSVCLDKVSTVLGFDQQMAKESEMGFETALPAGNVNYGDAFKTWTDRDENCDVLAKALGYRNGISSMGSDIIVVEPIFACKIDGEDVLMTVTEIACFGRDKYGAYQDGTMGGTNSGKFGFISRFTNMEFPNLLYVTSYSGTYLGEDAEGALTGRGTFDEIISKSYGIGIIYGDTAYTSYTLTIDPNGGKWMNETMVRSYQMKAYALRTIKAPTRSGYTFTGWKIESSGGCTLGGQSSGTSKSTNYKQGTGNCTLTAQWKQNTTYDLTLVGDEGVESFTTEDGTDAGGGVYTGFASGARPSCTVVLKEGYRLVEITGTGYNGSGTWNESSEGRLPATGSYTTTFTMKGNRTLYAVTEPTFRTLTVIGDEGIQEITGAGQYAYGAVPTVTVTAKPGYTLSHYYGTTHDGSGNATWQIAAGKTYDSDTWGLYADRTIYVYSKPIDYTLTYDPNGGSVTPGSTTFTYSGALTNLAVPTRAGYTFNRWYAEFNGSNYINLGRDYMYTDKLSMHLEAYMDDWSTYCTKNMRLISCTEGGGWNIESGNYNIAFGIYDAGVGYKSVTTSNTWASLGAGWHSFDLVFDGSYAYCYLDGTLVGTSVKFSSGKIGYHASNSIILGAEAGGSSTAVDGNYFTGLIANLSITHSSTRVTSTTSQFMAPAQDFTLKAEWTPIQYTVVYKPNGATGSDWSNTVTTGSNYAVKENWYSYTGYRFTGWSTNPDGDDGYGWTGWSGTWNYVNGQYGVSNNTLTLYAQWTPINYTITYDPNGGTLAGSATQGYNITTNVTLQAAPTRTGYTFAGWKLSTNTGNWTSGTYAASKNVGTGKYGNITLVAQWTPINYTITYNPNGGTLAGSANQSYNITTNVTLQAAPTRTGYTFAGWKLATATGNWTAGTYDAGKNVGTGKYGNITLIAQWTVNSYKYTVNHYLMNLDGKTYTLDSSVTGTATFGSKVTGALKSYTGFTAPSAQTITISANEKENVINYYYTRNKYTVTLINGTGISSVSGAGSYYYGESVTINANVLTGYAWSKWTGTHSTTTQKYTFTMPAANVTDTANATAIGYTITYDPNGGTLAGSANQSYNITTNVTLQAAPTRNGYTFAGWKLATATGNWTAGTYDAGKNVGTGKYGNITLVAQWTPINYTITYDPNGGTLVGNSPQTYDPTTSVTLQGAPTRPGYTFAGWKLAETTGNWYAGTYSAGKTVGKGKYGNITLVAQWASDTIKITLDKNGGTGGLDCFYFKYGINKYYSDANCTQEITSIALPSKTGYTFNRYYGDGTSGGSNGETYVYNTGSIATDLCTDIYKDATLYAEWTLNQYSYTVNYYLQNIGGDGYTLDANSTIHGTADFGSKVTGTVKSFTGFNPPSAQSIIISADEKENVINYYYTRNQYTVTVNKGTGISSATGAGKYWYGEQVSINAEISTGYAWSKWTGYVSTTDKQYSFTMPAKNVSVTANATPIDYTITYDPNGGSLVGEKTQGYIITTDITLQAAPTRTGYTFAGWKLTTATGNWTAGTYDAGKNVGTGKYGNITLIAQWTVNSYKYTVNHYLMNLDGKTYTLDSSVTGTATFGSKVTGALKSYTGFTAPSAQTITISANEKENVINYYYTRNKYTVTLINGTGISSVSGAGSYYYGESVTINADVLTGYAWSKWTGTHSTTTQKYTFTMPAANVTDTANATAIGYTITYDPNGGTLAGSANQSYNITTNVTLQAAPTRNGYTFAGWKLATATGNWTAGTYDAGKNVGTGKYGNITLVAQWTPNGYTITYDPNGGTLVGNSTQTYDPTISVTLQNAPTRTGYTFAGWKLATATGNWAAGTYEAGKNIGTGKYGNITLVAQWTPIQYTVVYKPNGAPGSDWSNTVTTGSNYTVEENWYSRTGYIFTGWSTNPNGDDGYGWTGWSGTWNYVNGQYGISNNTLTLYAQWRPIKYTIHYDGNGATAGSTPDSSHTYDVEQGLTPNGFTKPGYVPDGWNTKPDGSGTSYKDKESVKNLTDKDGDTITLYIQWKPITYNIQYVLNGGTHGASHPNSATYDQAFTVSNPTRGQGYVFRGWTITGMDGTTHYIGSSTMNSTSVSAIMDTVFKNLRSTEGTVTFTANWYSYDVELVDISFKYIDGSGNTQTVTDMNNMVYGTKYYVFYTYRNNSNTTVTADCYGSGKKLLATKTLAAGESVTLQGGSFTPGIGDGILSGYIYLNGCTFGDTSGEYNGSNNSKTVSFKTKFDIELKEIYLADANGNRLDPTQIFTNQKVYIHHVYKNNSGGSVTVNGYHQGNAITVSGSYAFTLEANATKDVIVKIHTPTQAETTTITGAVWRNGKSATTEYFETNLSNNTKSLAITVLEMPYLEPIRPNQGYRQGTDVITSYYVHNDSSVVYNPSNGITVTMNVYNKDTGALVTTKTQTVYVPANETQLIWFKWSVPEDATSDFRIKATIVANGVEGVLVDKTYSLATYDQNNTPDTEFEGDKPSWWTYTKPDSDYGVGSNWSVWEWENGAFVKKNYGIFFNSGTATINPFRSPTAVLKDGVWCIRSGYGFTLSVESATVEALYGGYLLPDSSAYTMPQYVYARYPEFQYKLTANNGVCGETTMEKVGQSWYLPDYLDYNGRCHFTPIWYPDGNYIVTVLGDDIWTPTGCYHIQTSAKLKISGSVYDDWYIS